MKNKLNKILKLKINDLRKEKILKSDLLMHSFKDGLDIVYAPFDHINKEAKIVIIGITPGWTQLKEAYKYIIKNQHLDTKTLMNFAKRKASFSGVMRNNLISWLDQIQLSKFLKVTSCKNLFDNLEDDEIDTLFDGVMI